MDRRRFISNSMVSAGAAVPAARHVAAQGVHVNETREPVLLATWPFGMKAVEAGYQALQNGGTALDAVEQSAVVTENDPDNTSVGYGGYPNDMGVVQLDAAIIEGKTGRMGSIGALENIKNPVSVARKLLEANRHVMLAGEGAKTFALEQGFKEENLLTPNALEWYMKQVKNPPKELGHDTIGSLALDQHGDMAVSCTTSGLGMKWPGRVGDSPLIGAGLYLDAEVGGAVGTGVGERAIETCSAFAIVELMRHGRSPQQACEELMVRVAKRNAHRNPFQLAFMALTPEGEYGAASLMTGFDYAVSIGGTATLQTGAVYGQDFE